MTVMTTRLECNGRLLPPGWTPAPRERYAREGLTFGESTRHTGKVPHEIPTCRSGEKKRHGPPGPCGAGARGPVRAVGKVGASSDPGARPRSRTRGTRDRGPTGQWARGSGSGRTWSV